MRDAYLQRRYKQVHGEAADTSDEWVELTSADPALKSDTDAEQTEAIVKPVVTENKADSAIVKPLISENMTDSAIVKPVVSENKAEQVIVKPVISKNETLIDVSQNESGKTDSVI